MGRGAHGWNFTKTILASARKGDQLQVVMDEFDAPATAALVVGTTALNVLRNWLNDDWASIPSSTFHLTTAGQSFRHGYALRKACVTRRRGVWR
ncbi:sugar nucleotide-binding protein [Cupriavidus sp. YAF13]|uniref:sugar nucleotide-binding protein n=1 Tax=Cupriavidus sp. YAF13 TaxID=3233075 RepID=UPI003F8F2A29